jgi:two-component system OmpR family response regulator
MTADETILVVDDEQNIRDVVEVSASQAGFEVLEASDGLEAWETFRDEQPELVVLDIMMPELDGKELCRKIRGESEIPIIFLTAKDEEIDRVVGLELGADDYVTKPFSPKELVARIKAILRRTRRFKEEVADERDSDDGEQAIREEGALRLDKERYEAALNGEPIELTKTEFLIVWAMMRYPGKVYSRDELMNRAYDPGVVVSDRTIDSHIRRAREKFKEAGNDPIETVHGLGYKLGDQL